MQLYYSPTSPFARKVKMVLIVTGLIEKTEIVITNFESDLLRKINPLGKVPALVDGDMRLFNSPLICEYLDEKYEEAGHHSLFRCGKSDYYQVQAAHALADGIMEAAVATTMERRRVTEPSTYWLDRWRHALQTAVENADIAALGNTQKPNIATMATMAALGYLDFRLPEYNWRQWNPELANWFTTLEQEPWFIATIPPPEC